MIRRKALRAFVVACAICGTAAPAFALSQDAQQVVDGVKALPNFSTMCSDQKKLRRSVAAVTAKLEKTHKLTGKPRAIGREATTYLHSNCP